MAHPAMKQERRASDGAERDLYSNCPAGEVDVPSSRQTTNHLAKRTSHFTNDLWLVVSVVTFAADIASAVVVAVKYYKVGELWWSALTLGFVLLASLTMQIFSARWFFEDGKTKLAVTYVLHLLQLGILVR